MLLKLKNKILLGLDKLIENTVKKGGVPNVVLLEPKKAAGFIRELGEFKNICKEHAVFEQKNDSDIDIRFLIQALLSKEELLKIIN